MKKIILIYMLIFTIISAKEKIRAVSTSQFTTEILLSIGAEDQVIGTSFLDDEILPELKEKYNRIPVLSKTAPTKELFYSLNPNFLTGWKSIATKKYLGTLEELNENGVDVYFAKSQETQNIEDIYEDILYFGEKFSVEKNAQMLVEKLKQDIETVKKLKAENKTLKIFAYDSQENAPYVVGGNGIANKMIEISGGKNIFNDSNFSFGVGNWERVLEKNPDVIVVVDYGDTSYEEKVKFLKERSPISELTAVQENKFIRVPLSYLSPGVRVAEGIKLMAEKFCE
ncbi:ABC transporter substrate-binding protein [Cetobacterium sp. 8H]|uniref:ABC transporter substrate-binding protein n=1 Tax=Cetobacterium sp. 8H TaxID=2759681 RepID=UPI00163C1E03|nr:ABC transporter substrate-binding protein [Cetobacterium sp. 8H]MBC2851122.1 ABC transporter substrate-binding protein [Cetobacterium sp. 8H]